MTAPPRSARVRSPERPRPAQTFATAIGANSQAQGANAIAIGGNNTTGAGNAAFASAANAIAIGNRAAATFVNSAAFGNGATTTRANQQVLGTAANTYTTPGITSAASLAAQTGPTQIVTSDAAGNLATNTAAGLGLATTSQVNAQVGGINSQLGIVNSQIGGINAQLGVINSQIGAINSQIGAINSQIGVINSQISSLSGRIDDVNNAARRGIAATAASADETDWGSTARPDRNESGFPRHAGGASLRH